MVFSGSGPSSNRLRYLKPAYFFFILLVFSGCSSIIDSRKQKATIIKIYEQGNYEAAAKKTIDKAVDREGTGDELMWRLEEGTLLFDGTKYDESLKAYEQAEKLIKAYDDRATVSARDVASEGAVMVTNLNALPYKGYNYDRIMLNVYKALDYFAMGKPNEAMVEIRRLHERQKDARKRFESEIEKEQERIKKQNEKNKQTLDDARRDNRDVSSASSDIDFNYLLKNQQISKSYTKTRKLSNKAYRDFVNPFATYVSAIGYLYDNNYSEALVDFRNLYKMEQNNKLIQRDLVTCARTVGSKPPDELDSIKSFPYPLSRDIVYVIYANGMAAAFRQVKIQLILPFVGYCGFAYPEIETFPRSYPKLTVSSGSATCQTVPVCDMDAVVASEYYQLLPMIITRIALSTLTKEIGSYVAVRAADRAGGIWAMLGAYLVTGFYKYLFNTADTRCWQTLPAEYQVIHFQKPHNGHVTVRAGDVTKEIQLDNLKKFVIIYIKSPKTGVLSVRKFEF